MGRLTFVLLLLLLSACATTGPEPSAEEIRRRAADRVGQLKSFRFNFAVANGAMTLAPGMTMLGAEGAVVAPDRIALKVDARAGGMALPIEVVGVGARQSMTNPLTGQWQDAGGALALPALLDPERGLAAVIRAADRLEKRGRVSIDGVDSFHLAGPIPAEAIGRLVGTGPAAAETVAAELWIDAKEFLPRRAKLVGPIVAGEQLELERTLSLTDFDAAISIELP